MAKVCVLSWKLRLSGQQNVTFLGKSEWWAIESCYQATGSISDKGLAHGLAQEWSPLKAVKLPPASLWIYKHNKEQSFSGSPELWLCCTDWFLHLIKSKGITTFPLVPWLFMNWNQKLYYPDQTEFSDLIVIKSFTKMREFLKSF